MPSQIAQTYAIAGGDQTVASLLAGEVYDGVKRIEIRVETGTIAVAVGLVLDALAKGAQLTSGASWVREASRFGIIDLAQVHIFGVDGNDTAFIDVLGF